MQSPLHHRVEQLLGPRGYLYKPEDLTLYEYDGGVDKSRPDLVVFPQSTDDVVAIVKLAAEYSLPIVGRGAGTGLSGGAIARAGGIVISFARMNRILEIDLPNERAVVQPGVVNLDITLAVDADGYFYAPDPSSQRACTIGGNVSENAGGPHTLCYGVTTNHVLGIEAVLPDGTVIETSTEGEGYDLTGILVGSEGTMVLVTKVIVRLMRKPEMVKTILAIYNRPEDAGETVEKITAHAITPAAIEMMDGVMLRMIEEATHAGYPMDAAAVLLIELEGLRETVEEQAEQIREVASSAAPANFASPAMPSNATSSGKAARTRSEPSAASALPIMCRMASSPARKSPRRSNSSTRWASATVSASATSFTPATATCTHSMLFDPRIPGEFEQRQAGQRRNSRLLHRRRRLHHRRARRRHGENGDDGPPVRP